MIKQIILRNSFLIVSVILLISFSNELFGQHKSNFAFGGNFGPSWVQLDQKTSQYIESKTMLSGEVYLLVRNVKLGYGFNSNTAYRNYLKQDIPYLDTNLSTQQDIRFSFDNLKLGYSINLKNNFSAEPYIGRLRTTVQELDVDEALIIVKGYCIGIEFYKWFFPKKTLCVYFKDQINITNLKKVNSNLGNFANVIEFGVGWRYSMN